ncbi:MAG TPA: alpha/beta hydrolase [Bacteroidia bacterium]|jgi:pimeloyl-ACP methyl ester carboxylesterase|nr:alpha/beta hydrolase [Bacteroidia bacterium]
MKFVHLFILLTVLAFHAKAQKLDNIKKDIVKKVNTLTQKQKTPLKQVAVNLENVEYPFPVHYLDLNLQGQSLKMAYMDVPAKKPNGETVLLMHGKNFCSAYWKKTATDLSKAGYRVIMPDQIGFGKSSKPVTFSYSFQLLAQNTKNMLDTLGIKNAVVLGHSMGGMLATRFTLMYPDFVKKLILENPIGLEDYKLHVPFQTVDENYKKELKQTYERLKDYEQTNYYGDRWKPEYDEWLNILAGMTLDPDYPRIAWNAALTSEMIYMQPVCYEFENIKAPTLLIIGQRDRTALVNVKTSDEAKSLLGNYPALGKLTAKKISASQLVEIPNVGHLPHVEAYPKFITPLLLFLKNDIKQQEEKIEPVKQPAPKNSVKDKLLKLKPKVKEKPKATEKKESTEEKTKENKKETDGETETTEKTENTEPKKKEQEQEQTSEKETVKPENTETEAENAPEKTTEETPQIGKSSKAEEKIKAKEKKARTKKADKSEKSEESKKEEEQTKGEDEQSKDE